VRLVSRMRHALTKAWRLIHAATTGDAVKVGRENRTLTRRELLRASGAAAGLAIAGESLLGLTGCSNPPGAPTDFFTLNVGYSRRMLGDVNVRTRTYNGGIPGPVMVTRPGHNLQINVVNQLPPNPPEICPPDLNPENNPHGFNTTNLHVHGLQVVPHLFKPLGTTDSNAPMIMIEPGEQFLYEFALPANHPSGLHWYHPHNHGSTNVQVASGMAGAILVKGPIDEVPEIAAARDELMLIQLVKLNPDLTEPNLWTWEPKPYAFTTHPPSNQGGFSFNTQLEFITVNGQAIQKLDYSHSPRPVRTQLSVPIYNMQPGEVIRLRILNGVDEFLLPITLPGFEMYIIGQDGINLLAPELVGGDDLTALRMAPANRAEVLIRAPMQPTTGTLISLEMTEGFEMNPQFILANFVVSGMPKPMEIPHSLPVPEREYPSINQNEIVQRRTIVFNETFDSSNIFKIGYTLNGQTYNEFIVQPGPAVVGTAEEWVLVNATDEGHPFHIHTNSFEVIGLPFDPNYRRVHDTIWIPPAMNNVPSTITIRMRFQTFAGKEVYHCHILPHEDQGMMSNFVIKGPESATLVRKNEFDLSAFKLPVTHCMREHYKKSMANKG
jgi:suppressor of ftsI